MVELDKGELVYEAQRRLPPKDREYMLDRYGIKWSMYPRKSYVFVEHPEAEKTPKARIHGIIQRAAKRDGLRCMIVREDVGNFYRCTLHYGMAW